MKIKIKIKQLSKLNDVFSFPEYQTEATTVEQLIREMVKKNVISFNEKREKKELFMLSDDTINALSRHGKIGFGDVSNKKKVDIKSMQDEAVFHFKHGRFKIVNETTKQEYTDINEPLGLSTDDVLVFIKLAMLAGRRF